MPTETNRTLTVTPTHLIMDGPTGRHTLLRSETDRHRLEAHWAGFGGDPAQLPVLKVRLTPAQIGRLEDADCKFRQAGKTVVVFACAEDVRAAISRTAGLHPDSHDENAQWTGAECEQDFNESQERFARAQIARSVDSLHEKLLTLLEKTS